LRADTPVDDIAALIDHLGLDQPDLVGYSLGGGVASKLFAATTITFLDEQSS
jgi:pimeloyl-ACP methyl ester carboxylesterase